MSWNPFQTPGRLAALGLAASVVILAGGTPPAAADPASAWLGSAGTWYDAPASVGRAGQAGDASVTVLAAASDLCAKVGSGAGFRSGVLVTAVAVALAESACRSGVTGTNGPTAGCPRGSRDRGLWQINDCHHPEVTRTCAYDAQCNAKAAYRISSRGANWKPWSAYRTGRYRTFLAAARTAVGRLGSVRKSQGSRNSNATSAERGFVWDVPDTCLPVTGYWADNATETADPSC